jgi:DNA replication and repair protein RecF
LVVKGWLLGVPLLLFCSTLFWQSMPVHLAHLRLRDFRNYPRLDADFAPGFHLLLGDNAQGKTNILEAIYLIATLRSFRGVGGAQMIRHGQKGYFVGSKIISQGEHETKMYWSSQERSLTLDGRAVRKLTDYLGVLRTVVFCTEDLQLIKGPSSGRRRFLDLLLSQIQPTYLPLRQRYTQALRSRNALLKRPVLDPAALDGFSSELVSAGEEIIRFRRELVPKFSPLARGAYQRIANDAEELRLEYQPSVKRDFAVELAQSRARERSYRSTVVGPHRDDLQLLVSDRSAAQFGSEGQKRTLATALKMAQAEYLTAFHGAPPILLIDDVMGELDLKRRSGFLPLLERSHQSRGQVFMTATEENWPRELASDVHRWLVKGGTLFTAASRAGS